MRRIAAAVTHRRLVNQYLAPGTALGTPADVVSRLGAVQAQDYLGAKWAVAQRTQSATDDVVEQAVIDGTILRTHVLRPTWHFVTPADIRWMLALTGKRVSAAMAYYDRTMGLDDSIFRRSNRAIAKVLSMGEHLTRSELLRGLKRSGIDLSSPQRLAHLMMRAELDAIVCSGVRHGKHSTYALLEQRVPSAPSIDRDEALFRLTRLYFATRGPAAASDFVWWSGLTMTDVKRGIEAVGASLITETIDGTTYWSSESVAGATAQGPVPGYLLPNYDEYFVSYKNRSIIGERLKSAKVDSPTISLLGNGIVLDGQLVGAWKRTLKPRQVRLDLNLAVPLGRAERKSVDTACRRYADYLGLSPDVQG